MGRRGAAGGELTEPDLEECWVRGNHRADRLDLPRTSAIVTDTIIIVIIIIVTVAIIVTIVSSPSLSSSLVAQCTQQVPGVQAHVPSPIAKSVCAFCCMSAVCLSLSSLAAASPAALLLLCLISCLTRSPVVKGAGC